MKYFSSKHNLDIDLNESFFVLFCTINFTSKLQFNLNKQIEYYIGLHSILTYSSELLKKDGGSG